MWSAISHEIRNKDCGQVFRVRITFRIKVNYGCQSTDKHKKWFLWEPEVTTNRSTTQYIDRKP